MTFIESLTALILISFFLVGFSQAFMPAYNAWNRAIITYQTAHTIEFIAKSFKAECVKPDRNIENWKKTVSTARALEHYEITEYWQDGILRALKASCIISGEVIEVIGLCTP
jgi:hypothetical protein